jgi:hypothetical protein
MKGGWQTVFGFLVGALIIKFVWPVAFNKAPAPAPAAAPAPAGDKTMEDRLKSIQELAREHEAKRMQKDYPDNTPEERDAVLAEQVARSEKERAAQARRAAAAKEALQRKLAREAEARKAAGQ